MRVDLQSSGWCSRGCRPNWAAIHSVCLKTFGSGSEIDLVERATMFWWKEAPPYYQGLDQ